MKLARGLRGGGHSAVHRLWNQVREAGFFAQWAICSNGNSLKWKRLKGRSRFNLGDFVLFWDYFCFASWPQKTNSDPGF